MDRPTLEVADLIRDAGPAFLTQARQWFTWLHLKLLRAILNCRTAALGGHVDACSRCGHQAISYNSCRNRHCPRCQTQARERWVEARCRDLLPTAYAHVVFTLHHALAPLALQNKAVVYDLLMRASADSLLEIARDPAHLGAEIGFFSVLHTWNQKLQLHPHVHCVGPAGGLSPDHSRWVSASPRFFLPVEVLAEVFRGKVTEGLRELYAARKLTLEGMLAPLKNPRTFSELLRTVHQKDWVVYAKRPFGGAAHVVQYLGRYTHRVAISSHRLLSLEDHRVTFRWRDSEHHNKQRTMALHVNEFLRRFFLHVLPMGFVRIRYFGLFAHRRRKELLPLCVRLLAASAPNPCAPSAAATDRPLWACSVCGAPMRVIERLSPLQVRIRMRAPPNKARCV
ncbi:MAG TPA: IS91 family transposase [Terriglobales bacterium]|nr:IS91 family transposase [Terriglobales bacterium]